MRYREWKLINESLAGGHMNLGLSNPQTLGGSIGSQYREMGDDLLDNKYKDEEDDDDLEDEDDLDGDDETDLFGDDEMDPDMDFPPDDSEDMDGLPTPDEEMLDGDEDDMGGPMDGDEDDDFLNDIDPELAGLDGGEGEMNLDMGDEAGEDDMDGLSMDDMGDMGDEAGEDDMDGLSMDDMGDEVEDDEMGDDTLSGLDSIDMGDVEVGEEGDDDKNDFMSRMADYCGRYMASHMASHMTKKSRKFMHKDSGKKTRKHMCAKGKCDDGVKSREDMTDMASNHFGTTKKESVGTYSETEDQFLSTLRTAAKGDHNIGGWSGLSEDMLVKMNDPNANFAPNDSQAGQAGFAPQGRIGSIGAGYTQDDLQDIQTMSY